jgi:hypothetical protein
MGLGEAREVVNSTQHLREGVAARQLEEAVALERVDRHVEAVDAGADERLGVALEREAVGRDRQVVDGVDLGEHLRQPRELLADERLSSGQAHVAHAHFGEHADETRDFLEGQDFGPFEPGQALGRHAVLAAEVAAVGHRHPEIADQTPVPVAERLALH